MKEISIFSLIKKGWWFIVIFAGIFLFITYQLLGIVPVKYKSSQKVFVTSNQSAALANVYDAPYADRAVKTIVVLATSDQIEKMLSEKTGVNAAKINIGLKAQNIAGTQIVDISYTGNSIDDVQVVSKNFITIMDSYLSTLQKDTDQKNQIGISVAEDPSDAITISYNNWQYLAAALMLFLLLGFSIIYLIEYFDDSIKSGDSLEKININYLGDFGSLKGSSNDIFAINNQKNRSSLEMLREVRTNISFIDEHKGVKSIVITSSKPKEGKSLFATNIAILLAETGKKVALVDADFRSPFATKIFKMIGKKGLFNYLLGQATYNEVLNESQYNNLWIVPAADERKNVNSDALKIEKIKEFIQKLVQGGFDIILFDSPPIGLVTDPAIISQAADGVILICQTERTKIHELTRIKEVLLKVGANILGAVMTKSKDNRKLYNY